MYAGANNLAVEMPRNINRTQKYLKDSIPHQSDFDICKIMFCSSQLQVVLNSRFYRHLHETTDAQHPTPHTVMPTTISNETN
jgi:hypothetical protein